MSIPEKEWNIGKLIIKEKKWSFPDEYQIIITMGGINIEKNGGLVLKLNPQGFIDYHISSQELVIKYDKSQNILHDIEYEHDNNQRMHILYNGGEGYGPNELRIPIRFFSDNDKKELCSLMRKVDDWKKDKYAFVYGNPIKVKSKVGNEGIIAIGRACLKFDDTVEAEKFAKEALEIHPTLDCYLLLLDVYKEMNNEAAFRATCEEALKHIDNVEERAVLNEKIENSFIGVCWQKI